MDGEKPRRGGRKPTGVAKVQASCRIDPRALQAWRKAGGTRLSTDIAAAFELKWMPDDAWMDSDDESEVQP